MSERYRQLLQGVSAGVLTTTVVGGAIAYGLKPGAVTAYLPAATAVLEWIDMNLGFATVPFVVTALLFLGSLRKLRDALRQNKAVEDVAQAEHLVDIWTSLFFGIGVIWTAIGMRSGLVYALGDPTDTLRGGAYVVLQRMVDGGILLALSTTIVGGVGGYLMRLIKTLSVGTTLKRYYERRAGAQGIRIQSTLDTIEAHLARLARERERGTRQAQPLEHMSDES